MNINEQVTRWFGETDSKEQASHLNEIAGALLLACGRDLSKEGTQLCYVAENLDTHGARFVTQLAEFVRLRSEQGSVTGGAA